LKTPFPGDRERNKEYTYRPTFSIMMIVVMMIIIIILMIIIMPEKGIKNSYTPTFPTKHKHYKTYT